jgi:hypothetical protein
MKRRVVLASTLACVLPWIASFAVAAESTPSQNGTIPQFYAGLSGGQTRIDDRYRIGLLDRDEASWKALLGWRFTDRISLEASHIDFGTFTAPGSSQGTTSLREGAKASALEAVGYLANDKLDLFAKVGLARIDMDGALARPSDQTTQFTYGWGLQWHWRNFAIRGEYERFDSKRMGDLDTLTAGVTYTFSTHARG